jgi:hypothetical protein
MRKHGPEIKALELTASRTQILTAEQVARGNTLCVNSEGMLSIKENEAKNGRTRFFSAYLFNGMVQIEYVGKDPQDDMVTIIIRALKCMPSKNGEVNLIFEGNGIANLKVMTIQPNGEVRVGNKPTSTIN